MKISDLKSYNDAGRLLAAHELARAGKTGTHDLDWEA